MDRKSSHPMWFSLFSCRVAPKPITYIEGQGPPMPTACLPWISPRRFNLSHGPYESDANENWNVWTCTRDSSRSTMAKSNSYRGEEPESPSVPACGSTIRPDLEWIVQALERGRMEHCDILSRSAMCMPFPEIQGEFVQGIRKLQKLVSIQQSHGLRKKLFTSCLAANTQLNDCEPETEIQPTPPDPFFSPGGKTLACGTERSHQRPNFENGFSVSELEKHADTATRMSPESSKGIGLRGCLRFETQSERDATVNDEYSLPPYTCLPPIKLEDVVRGMKTLVLNLNGTLIHPSLEPIDGCDFRIPAWVNRRLCEVFVVKRPGLDKFLQTVARMYEVVVFTSCSRQYTDLVLDILDTKSNCIRYRLYEDACTHTEEGWLKDLSVLGRDLTKVITVDTIPNSYSLQPANSLQVGKYTGDKTDRELEDLLLDLELVWRLNV